nr:MAG TPA: hypothetical protein [Caudoviricetes sp.]
MSITCALCTVRCELCGKYTTAYTPLSRGGSTFSKICGKTPEF